jgi:hypothetical protein
MKRLAKPKKEVVPLWQQAKTLISQQQAALKRARDIQVQRRKKCEMLCLDTANYFGGVFGTFPTDEEVCVRGWRGFLSTAPANARFFDSHGRTLATHERILLTGSDQEHIVTCAPETYEKTLATSARTDLTLRVNGEATSRVCIVRFLAYKPVLPKGTLEDSNVNLQLCAVPTSVHSRGGLATIAQMEDYTGKPSQFLNFCAKVDEALRVYLSQIIIPEH